MTVWRVSDLKISNVEIARMVEYYGGDFAKSYAYLKLMRPPLFEKADVPLWLLNNTVLFLMDLFPLDE